MDKVKQILALAEFERWGAIQNNGLAGGWLATHSLFGTCYGRIFPSRELAIIGSCPDYLNDLNAINEAEKSLTFGQYETYWDMLVDALTIKYAVRASAEQRAEALLRTIGKWEE